MNCLSLSKCRSKIVLDIVNKDNYLCPCVTCVNDAKRIVLNCLILLSQPSWNVSTKVLSRITFKFLSKHPQRINYKLGLMNAIYAWISDCKETKWKVRGEFASEDRGIWGLFLDELYIRYCMCNHQSINIYNNENWKCVSTSSSHSCRPPYLFWFAWQMRCGRTILF